MQPRAATQCNLGLAYERWGGHDAEALAAYRRCAAEDDTGRFRDRALRKARALETGSRDGGAAPAGLDAPWPSRATIAWEKVQKAPRCVFFSGPAGLGQTDRLGTAADVVASGETVSLVFEGGAEFRGRRMGGLVTMSRRTVYSRDGGRWIVEEIIAGMLEDDVLSAEYHYHECDEARRAECPGPCSIHAELRVSLARRGR